MNIVYEEEPIRTILMNANKMMYSDQIEPEFACTVVESHSVRDGELHGFEGTVLYFPGVRAAELFIE